MDGNPNIETVALVHDAAAESGDKASLDVFDQMRAIEMVFGAAGVRTVRMAVGLNLWDFRRRLQAESPTIVFNLVESLERSDRLQSIVPLVLEDWRVPFTGSGSAAMLLSNNKMDAKARLADRGLPVAESVWLDTQGRLRCLPGDVAETIEGDWIVKPAETHASMYIDDASVLRCPGREVLTEHLAESARERGIFFFAERFIDGREFNITVLENADGEPEVMPPAEIRFDGLSPDKPRIVGYAAKWDEESPEYRATPRSFDFPAADAPLLARLRELSLAAWRAIGLSGYGRIDFRVDASGRPFILEANTNPCLTPDAGLPAAAERGGVKYSELLSRIAAAGFRRGGVV